MTRLALARLTLSEWTGDRIHALAQWAWRWTGGRVW